MRKLVSMLLIMLVAFGAVFAAEPGDLGGDTSGGTSQDIHTPNKIYLKANVPEGSGIDDDEISGGDDPVPDKNRGLRVLVGIPRNESESFNGYASYTKGDLVGLQNFASPETAKEVTLVPANAGDTEGSVVIYYAAAAKMAETQASIKYKVTTNGFKSGGNTVHIDVANYAFPDSSVITAIKAEADDTNGVEVIGVANGNHTDYVYVATTTLSWEKSADYAAGDYVAEIGIEINAV